MFEFFQVPQITFEYFDLEDDVTGSCSYDNVMVYDGDGDSLRLQACGSDIPDPITGTQRTMRIDFVTDSSMELTGFQLRWESVGTAQSSSGYYATK